MEKQALMKKAYEKVMADYNTLEKEWLGKEPKWLIDHAYEMAHMYEAFYFLDYALYGDNADNCRFTEDELKVISDFKSNTIAIIYDEWLTGNYENEYTNFFCWEHLAEITDRALFGKERF